VRSHAPPLDRAALLAICLLVPACVNTRQAQVSRGPAGPVMPAIQVAVNQSDEPPLAKDIVVSARPPGEPGILAILPIHTASSVGVADQVLQTNAEESASEPGPWSTPELKRTESPLLAAIRCYLNKSPEQAARCLESMDQPDRELLVALLPLAVRLGDGALKATDPQDVAAIMADVQALMDRLRERAALEVPKLCFCRPKVAPAQFGMYDLLEENHRFRPGEWVGLYVEVKNFTSVPHGDDYQTHMQMAIEVHNDRGETVWRFNPPGRTDPSLSPRQDYCHVGRFPLPDNLPAGAYTLWLKVTDVPTGRTARRALDFRVTTVKDVRSGGTGT
jgi:hypothetical protein